MSDLLLGLLVNLGLVVGLVAVWRWTRRVGRHPRFRWRRRMALLLLTASITATFGRVVLPDAFLGAIEGVLVVQGWIDGAIAAAQGEAKERLSGPARVVVGPVVSALAHLLVGALVGWPLDRLFPPEAGQGEAKAPPAA